MPARRILAAALMLLAPAQALAQSASAIRLLVLQAEGRKPTVADIGVMRLNAQSANVDTARVAVRTLGRLERPSLIPDILPALRHSLPEVRAEAANALAEAARGARGSTTTAAGSAVTSAQTALITRLGVEADGAVRGAICEALARLPYLATADIVRTETAIIDTGRHAGTLAERLGVARALEAFVRAQTPLRVPSPDLVALLRQLASPESAAPGLDLLRDARIRRLAMEGLIAANAMDERTVERAAEDADAQVRRLAMRAIELSGAASHKLRDGLVDPSPLVRIDALRALRARGGEEVCTAAFQGATDADLNTALVALDQLATCPASTHAVDLLARIAGDTSALPVVRGWHQQAHAIVALATAAPDRARPLLGAYASAPIWQVRSYAARAARQLEEHAVLETLARDPEPRVANVALAALSQPLRPRETPKPGAGAPITAAEIRRLAAPRARIVIRDVGTIELALFTTEAPGTVVRFARLAEQGYYNGLSFDRLAPNAIVQGGDKGQEDAMLPLRETGTWPHVRGAVGASAPDTGDAQLFFNLVDNPQFDHQYTVFAQVLNGADVIERLLEGDTIESITILP